MAVFYFLSTFFDWLKVVLEIFRKIISQDVDGWFTVCEILGKIRELVPKVLYLVVLG